MIYLDVIGAEYNNFIVPLAFSLLFYPLVSKGI